MAKPRKRHGFTLIEIVIAIMITAMIVVPLGLIVKSTVQAKVAVETEARARRLGPNIIATIANDLRNTWCTGPVKNVEIEGSWFKGDHNGDDDSAQDELYFVSSVNSYMRYEGISSDITEVGYYVKTAARWTGCTRCTGARTFRSTSAPMREAWASR
jgi:prepilin-type N-terminal cleavage/methylation domain-containing protein